MNGGRSFALASPCCAFNHGGSPDLSNPSCHQCLSPPAPSPLPDALRAAPVHALRRAMGKPPHTGVVEPRRGALSPHPRHSGPQPHLEVFPLCTAGKSEKQREGKQRKKRRRGKEKGERSTTTSTPGDEWPRTTTLPRGAEGAAAQERRAAQEDAEYADDCGLYHDNAPALHQVTATTTSSCLAVAPTSPMVSRSTKPPPFHPAACL
jgi:hypothetical protein